MLGSRSHCTRCPEQLPRSCLVSEPSPRPAHADEVWGPAGPVSQGIGPRASPLLHLQTGVKTAAPKGASRPCCSVSCQLQDLAPATAAPAHGSHPSCPSAWPGKPPQARPLLPPGPSVLDPPCSSILPHRLLAWVGGCLPGYHLSPHPEAKVLGLSLGPASSCPDPERRRGQALVWAGLPALSRLSPFLHCQGRRGWGGCRRRLTGSTLYLPKGGAKAKDPSPGVTAHLLCRTWNPGIAQRGWG